MVGVEGLGLDEVGGFDELFVGHRVGEVLGQEGQVDLRKVLHGGNRFRVAGQIDLESVEIEDIAVTYAARMEQVAVGIATVHIVRLHGPDADAGPSAAGIVGQHHVTAVHPPDVLAHDEGRFRGFDLGKGLFVVMVVMVVGDQDQVGFGIAGEVVDLAVRVGIDGLATYAEPYGGVAQHLDPKVTHRCRERFHRHQ